MALGAVYADPLSRVMAGRADPLSRALLESKRLRAQNERYGSEPRYHNQQGSVDLFLASSVSYVLPDVLPQTPSVGQQRLILTYCISPILIEGYDGRL